MPLQDPTVPTLLQPLQTKFSPARLDEALNKVVYARVMEMSESVERTALRLTVGDFLLSDRHPSKFTEQVSNLLVHYLTYIYAQRAPDQTGASLFLRPQKTRRQRNLNQAKSTPVKVHLNKRL